ncbi:MAG: NAD(P)-dependent oxidoreductase [Kiritimatiellae bacterium]|nr:NAD(P)-dependent oxidoreductase [Kiritimatiellia bacterium]MDW8459015.1 NAD(P)-dependent oxidoreductase [Verrucomicrobiota bacterium]
MKILVTGASGFVGAHLARALLARGHAVRAVYLPADPTDRLNALAPDVERLPLDLAVASESMLEDAIRGMDACVHAAWYAVPGRYLTAPENLVCLSFSIRLLQAAARLRIQRFVGIGSCAEYDTSVGDLDEQTPLRPTTLYAAAKASVFLLGEQMAAQTGMSFAWCRLFYLYGPFEPANRLVSDLFANLLAGKPCPVTSGRQVRDFLHISDAAAAVAAVVESDLRGPVNIGSGEAAEVRQVVEMAAELTGRSDLIRWGARPENLLDPPRIVAINSKLRQIGWSPVQSLKEGLRDTMAWWKERIQ